jgi:hypothetical protein
MEVEEDANSKFVWVDFYYLSSCVPLGIKNADFILKKDNASGLYPGGCTI